MSMRLEDEIARMIRFDLSADPLAREALLTGESVPASTTDAIATVNAYCNALATAILRVADEIDALRMR